MTSAMRCACLFVLICCCQVAFSASHALAQTLTLAPVGVIDGPAEFVQVEGHYAYVIAEKALRVYDVSKPSTPQRVGAFTFSEHIRGFRVSRGVVYAAADFFGLRIVDASNPTAPVLRGSLQTRGELFTVALGGGNLLVATSLTSGLTVIDVSDAARPAFLTSFFYTEGSYAQAVAASAALAYATDSAGVLYVLDLSKPESPAVVSMQETMVKRMRGGSRDGPVMPSPLVAILEPGTASPLKIALILERTSGLLQVYDVSNPRAPVKVSTFQAQGRPQALGVHGSLAYIGGPEGLQIVDFSNPSTPLLARSFKTAGPTQAVALADSLVLAAMGKGGVVIFRHSR